MTMTLTSRIDTALGRMVDYRPYVLLRVALGPLVLLHLGPFLAAALDGRTYRDSFIIPFVSWFPHLPAPVYIAALFSAAAAAVLVSVGLLTRLATGYVTLFVLYNLLASQTHYHHNRAFLAALLIGASLMPLGERLSLDAARGVVPRHDAAGWAPQWPLLILRFQIAAVYVASGLSKLVDGDWFGGTVTRLRVTRDAAGELPLWLYDVVTEPGFHAVAAKGIVLTELAIGIGLLVPRLRWAAVWLAIPFHIAIELTAEVQVFSYAALAALVVWVAPRSGDLVVEAGDRWWAVVRWLDWTGRFTLAPGRALRMVDQAGVAHEGRAAVLRVLRLLPATFWAAAPLVAVSQRGRFRSICCR